MSTQTGHIRVACIGAGYFSQFHHEAWNRIPTVKLVGAVSKEFSDALKTGLRAFEDLSTMLSSVEPDLVDIITPPSTHLELISLCANAGVRTVICQKPFCASLDQAREAVELCEMLGTTLVVHENFRFQPWYRTMKKAISENWIGDIHQLSFRLRTGDGQGKDAYMDRQPYFQEMERFLIHETGIHWVDTFRYLLGKPSSVYADLRKLNQHIKGEDAGIFIFEYVDGRRAVFDANRHVDHDAANCRTTLGEASLEGSEGTISLYGNGELSLRKHGSRNHEVLLQAREWETFAGDCVFALQSHVINNMQNGETIETLARDYLENLRIEEAIYQSAKTAKKVSLT